jgi:hypothetical protein
VNHPKAQNNERITNGKTTLPFNSPPRNWGSLTVAPLLGGLPKRYAQEKLFLRRFAAHLINQNSAGGTTWKPYKR